MRRAAWVAGVSQECLSESRTWFGVPQERLVLIPNGRDPAAFRPSPADAEPRSEPVVVWVGRFARGKRPEIFLDVVERMRREGLSFSARMIGDGPELSSLRPRALRLGIELLGARDDVPELLRAADVLVFTSLPAGEGMPGVFVEAGLSGLPVVTTDVPGARTVILETQTGYIEGVSDVQGLAARTAALVKDRALREKLGAAARARCAHDFTLEASARRWQDLLDRVLS
jgi:glycosyltransferase involved in cell wall biosynthesis